MARTKPCPKCGAEITASVADNINNPLEPDFSCPKGQ